MDLSRTIGLFSDDVFKLVVNESHNENVLLSPLSLSIAMSMLMAGAKNNSLEQVKNLLKLPVEADLDQVHNFYCDLATAKLSGASNETNEQLLIKNLALVSKFYGLLSEYEEKLKSKYKAEISEADFKTEGGAIVRKVNEWVNNSTKGLIPTVLEQPPQVETAMILLNCVYFKANWLAEFDDLGEREFNINKSIKKKVAFMSKKTYYKHLKVAFNSAGESVEMIEIPYNGSSSMIIMLPPKSASANELIAHKSLHNFLMQLVNHKGTEEISLHMPKFIFKSKMVMNEIFKKLGATDIFSPHASDLTGITRTQRIFVSEVVHSTVIEVDEKGTKAAGATEITFSLTSFQPPKIMTVDRPFVFFIFDSEDNIPIFVGKLEDPEN